MSPSEPTKGEKVCEGKAKEVFATSDKTLMIQCFKDDATAGDGDKRGTIESKGVCNNKISSICFEMLEKNGVATHFVKMLNEREMLIHKLDIFPIEVVVRNIAAGSLSGRLGLEEGTVLPFPVVEFYLKNDALHDPMINRDHIRVLTSVTEGDVKVLSTQAKEVNVYLKEFFYSKNLVLVDFKLEFGRDSSKKTRLGDEISPDTCRLWDRDTHEKLDKDRFRRDLGKVEEAYREVLKRVSAA
ncbi:MAG: phosphoribosylaminoimidazolesuccinocarboxamide synthase [bacterium]